MGEHKVITKEMGLTHKDFFRTIKNAIGDEKLEINSNGVILRSENKILEVKLGPERKRSIGLLKFPVTDIRISYVGYSTKAVKQSLKRFNLYFKRGGG